MCGINGIYGLEGISDPEQVIRKMNGALQHRGPDAEGTYQGENIVLGHRRLSIIDLSEQANQPFRSADGRYRIVYNGELYNFREIREELERDFSFVTNSDTEVVLKAFIKWGSKCLERFNGMFAFAIWDEREEALFLSRDRLGIKPLYYSFERNHFVFSSEIRGLLSSGMVSKDLDPQSLLDYLHYQTVHGEFTLLKEVKMLSPGTWLRLKDNEVTTGKYWQINKPVSFDLDEQGLKEVVKTRFEEAVKKRLVSDVDFGAFLSGGIDSSLVLANMAKHHPGKVKTFNVSFQEQEFSEAKYAQMVADRYDTEHHEIRLEPADLLNILPEALSAMDHPSGDGPNTYLVSKATKEAGVTMVLSGLGGDELFAGYPVFKQLPELYDKKWILSFPKVFRSLAGNVLRKLKPSVASDKIAEILTLDYFDLAHAYPQSRKGLTNRQFEQYFFSGVKFDNRVKKMVKESVAYGTPGFGMPFLSKISAAEIQSYLQSVLLRDTDQMSMAHALEVRVPFLDHELVELLLSVPDEYKSGGQKQLLLNSFEGYLPEEVYNRKKMGFVFPWQHWMRNELKGFCIERLRILEQERLFKPGGVEQFAARFFNGDPQVTWSRVWHLVVLGNWLQQLRKM